MEVRVSFQTYPQDPTVDDTVMISPLWYGFHDGTFDSYQIGQLASPELAGFATAWGSVDGLTEAFQTAQPQGVTGSIHNIDWRLSGLDSSNHLNADLDPVNNRFFSYVGRLTPSDDGFVANPNGQPQLVLGGRYIDPTIDFEVEYRRATTDFTRKNFRLMRIRIERYAALDGRYSGPWYNPERDGEGFSIHVVDRDDPRIVVYWFTYAPDGSGEQIWLVGVLPAAGNNSGAIEMYEFRGGEFNSTSNPELAMGEYWGTLTFNFSNCRRGSVSFTPKAGSRYEAGEFDIERLSTPPLGLEDTCAKF